jgi:hypothetical protein
MTVEPRQEPSLVALSRFQLFPHRINPPVKPVRLSGLITHDRLTFGYREGQEIIGELFCWHAF